MKCEAIINLPLSSEKQLKIMLEALKPETKTSSRRSRVHIKGEEKTLTLNFEAADTSALRASINSYLRQTSMLIDLLRLIEESS